MRGYLLVTLFALTASQSFAAPQCPPGDSTNGDILLKNPADCTTFYKCVYGVPYLMPCPSGLEWSEELNRCEYPEIAQCTETEEPPTTISTTTVSTTSRRPRPDRCPDVDGPEDVLLPNPADCGSFFKCLNGVPHLMRCPANQEWSVELNRCDYPEIAQCIETETSTPSRPTSSTIRPPRPDRCPAVDGPEDVLLPNPKDCGSFFKCLNGVPHLIPCPSGQEWSIELNRCDYPEIANCQVVQSRPVHPVPPNENGCPAVDGPEDVLLPNPADCGSFFKCLAGEPVLHYCLPGLEWSVELNRCEYPEIAQCVESETSAPTRPTTAGPTSSTERPTQCPSQDGPEDVLLPNPADCGTFYKCSGGVPVLEYCLPGLEWSIELNRCEFPEVAQCVETETSIATRPTTPDPTSTRPPSDRPDHCPEEDGPEDVLLPNPEDCGSFFKCLNGVPHQIDCPPGQEWSIELNRCDLPEIAKCQVDQSRPVHPVPSNENGCPAVDGPEDVLLPNPADCGSFFKCLAGEPVLHYCLPGLEWSVELNRCEYPEIAQCVESETSAPTRPTTAGPTSSTERPTQCPSQNGPEDVFLPNPADCGSFYQCSGGLPILQYCLPGLEWSVELNRCEFPEVAQCVETETSIATRPTTRDPTSTRPPSDRPDHCPEEDGPEDVLLPNPEDCRSFFKCLNGVPHQIDCPSGQEWSIELNRCDFPEIAQCEETAYRQFMSLYDAECLVENNGYDILLANPDDCSTYFQCSNGVKILKDCPEGTLWDAVMVRCDHAAIARCA